MLMTYMIPTGIILITSTWFIYRFHETKSVLLRLYKQKFDIKW